MLFHNAFSEWLTKGPKDHTQGAMNLPFKFHKTRRN